MNFPANKGRHKKAQSRGDYRTSPARQNDSVFRQPKPMIQTTSLWDFPSQHYGDESQGDGEYAGVTPSYVIWNLLNRYTKPQDKVLDPMCGSGTTLDVCKDLNRQGVGFDIAPNRDDIQRADARSLPLKSGDIDFVFLDPPYSTHIKYSGNPKCIGELDARGGGYYEAMEAVIAEIYRVLKNGGYLGLYIQDSFAKGKPFAPLGFELFLRLSHLFEPVDIICVARHNKKLKRNHWHTAAIEGNYFLRGFNYLFVFRKNTTHDAQLLKHDTSGSLSFYFRQVAAGRPNEVVTPAILTRVIETEQAVMDKKLLRKEEKKSAKAFRRKSENPSVGRDQRFGKHKDRKKK
jgi:DNA modification methylase